MGVQLHNEVRIDITFDGDTITLPVAPEKLSINRKASNSDIDIIGLGPATRKGQPGLLTMQFDSFFPHPFSNFYKYDYTPEDYINFINRIWEAENINNKVARLQTWYLEKNLSIPIVIDSFSYEYKGGDLDVWYSLSVKEYVPYGVRVENLQNTGMANVRTESSFLSTLTSFRTYTVKEGDTLFSIAMKCTGNSGNWNTLYQLNKDIIGSDGVSLKPGQQLVLPDGWTIPVVKNTATTSSDDTNKGAKPIYASNDATANEGTISSKPINTHVSSSGSVHGGGGRKMPEDEWSKYYNQHINIMNYLRVRNYEAQNSEMSDKYKQYFDEGVNAELKRLQNSFNKANKQQNNPNISQTERNAELKKMYEIENQLYRKIVNRYSMERQENIAWAIKKISRLS